MPIFTGVSELPDPRRLGEYHDEWASMYLRDDDIVEVHLRAGSYNAEKVLKVIDDIKLRAERPHLLVLVITDAHSMVTYSGITAVFSRPAINYSMAKAYVFQTGLQFFLARVGHAIFRPVTPIRFFKERSKAELWLKSFQGYGV